MRYKCPHCPVECLVVDGVIEPCGDHPWAPPEPALEKEEESLDQKTTDTGVNSNAIQ